MVVNEDLGLGIATPVVLVAAAVAVYLVSPASAAVGLKVAVRVVAS
jgi:hypothetical protein